MKKPIVLVGIMGAGKTTVGSRLARALDLPFYDVDQEVEKIACCSVADIFFYAGEEYFRKVELSAIKSLLSRKTPMVIATGGGAFINEDIRQIVKEQSISVWLKANLDILVERVSKKPSARPLLDSKDTRKVMESLIMKRYPIYAEADITVNSDHRSHSQMIKSMVSALEHFLDSNTN